MQISKVNVDEAPLKLLALADPSSERVSAYLQTGTIFVGKIDGEIVAAAVLEKRGTECELMNLAISVTYQSRGFGTQMLLHVIHFAASVGAKRLTVGTGNSSLRQLNLYQKNGFRITGVVPDFFRDDSPIYENGIRCLDLVRLVRDLDINGL